MMIEPTIALKTAIRSALIASPAVLALVPADNIRSGSTRPDRFPCVILADGTTVMLGHAAGGQYLASVSIDLHVWALEDGQDTAKRIGAALARVLMDWPHSGDIALDNFKHISTVWPRDPDPEIGHGVLSVEAVVRWRL